MMDYGAVYSKLHANPKAFTASVVKKHVDAIAQLVSFVQPRRILDYGCGKGYQYLRNRVHERWGGLLPYCYDVGVRALSERPEGVFDGIICTDVMEHIDEPDVPLILADIVSFLNPVRPAFLFFSIACIPSHKESLPDGRNLHLTIKQPKWWDDQIERAIGGRTEPSLLIDVKYDTRGLK